jgi:hypothetical protein
LPQALSVTIVPVVSSLNEPSSGGVTSSLTIELRKKRSKTPVITNTSPAKPGGGEVVPENTRKRTTKKPVAQAIEKGICFSSA